MRHAVVRCISAVGAVAGILLTQFSWADSSDITPQEMEQIRQRMQEKQRIEDEAARQYFYDRRLESRLRSMEFRIDEQQRQMEFQKQMDSRNQINQGWLRR